MLILGILIALGAAAAFAAVAALTLYGSADATRNQIVPGFAPDRPGPAERLLTFLGVWGPVAFVALLCVLAALKIVSVAFGALSRGA
jgi:hypothetical protein